MRWLLLIVIALFFYGCGDESTPSEVKTACDGITCSNHGVCVVENSEAVCHCDDGYVADQLTCVAPVYCPEVDCSGHGTCVVLDGKQSCQCESGYVPFNLSCVPEVNPCIGVDCGDHGFCVVNNGAAGCNCNSGYHAEGLNCVEDVVDLCSGITCDYWKRCDGVDGLCKLADGYCDGECDGDQICGDDHLCSDPPVEPEPVRYHSGRAIAPMNRYMFQQLQTLIDGYPGKNESVFIKVGASGTVSTKLLYCADTEQTRYDLDLNGETELMDTINYFQTIRFDGKSSFNRETLAAMVGKTAYWVQDGDPSPFDAEVAALNPRFALINYGTNDMGYDHAAAIFPFIRNLERLIQHSLSLGIIPVITGLNPRTDKDSAKNWVTHFNNITRGVAEKYQIPYLDLFYLAHPLNNEGMVSDGIHGNAYSDGTTQPCIFTEEGLGFNYNTRNLHTIRLLHQLLNGLNHPDQIVDEPISPHSGSGSSDDPVIVDQLPFTHHSDTTGLSSKIDLYETCGAGLDESGGELYYKLQLDEATPLRMMVFDNNDTTDIDIHILKDSPEAANCLERAHLLIEGSYGPGTYYIVADSYVKDGVAKEGAYTLLISRCRAEDSDCE